MNDWAVYRQDFNANEFLVQKGLSKDEAGSLADEYLAKGHHQHYWFDKQPSEDVDFASQLLDMLGSGSSHELAIKVCSVKEHLQRNVIWLWKPPPSWVLNNAA